ADENFASDIDFSQVTAGLKFITSFGPRDRIIARGGAGGTETPDFDQLPASLRFYTGGSQTVRGYKYNSLGPTNDDGEVIGARYLLFGGIDYEHYFNDRWGMALFIDAGNAIDSFDDDLEQGAGFGLRWKSPIGPVRIDLANAISDEDRPWRLHVNIGPDL
ncbi:MAG: BamA/TamA family outer membrane protein, partial [Gammaproteobacteria bacterium]